MKTSCGLILTDGDFILFGNSGNGYYDLPKGHQKENESYLETCDREVKEETNFDVSGYYLIDLGLFDYLKKKNLYLFLLRLPSNKLPKEIELKCNSTFIDRKSGLERLEFVDFKYIHKNKIHIYVTESMNNVLRKIIKNHLTF